ncbi:TonB-dependent receptor [Coralloluteibacterium stylophorae]|uniref:TonB-dependent receptor n=1 Tax=Coralloluteibacterium stylophorae TaxID=1776034 RepID=A0AAP2FZG3_9GAMM|nr:TonB-dependent receptor [Coralloluteibacterium stylophorae]MBS7456810.1 TonB-dependent receptor [Coralloluteibacterium stylophorae]
MSALRLRPRPAPLAAAIALLLPALAAAQEPAAPPVTATRLDAVTVTAERREENAQDVPASLTTLDGEKLDVLASGGNDIRFLAARVPSLNIESSFGRSFPRFYVRGYGNSDFDLNASQPVSLVYDDIVLENPMLKGFPVFDLDRIEVLRGPQGTLFGRNTPAGVVKFESVKPSQVADGYLRLGYGSYGTATFEGAFGGALTESWSARISGLYQHRDDYVDNTFSGEDDAYEGYDDSALRAQFLFDPGTGFSALFNVHARHYNGTARLFRANIIEPGTNDLVDGFERDEVAYDGRNESTLDTEGASARLTWDLGRVSLYSVTGYESAETYNRGDIDGGYGAVFAPPSGPGLIPFPSESADGLPFHRQLSQEFRLASNEWGRFDWQAGVFWFDEAIKIDSFDYATLAGGVQDGYAQQKQDNTAWAVFASAEYDLTDRLELAGGLRYTRDEKDFSVVRTQSPTGAGPLSLSTSPDATDTSGDASLTYAVTDDLNVYGRIARGFRAPSIQGRVLFGDSISVADAETVWSYELGTKASFWDNRARAGFAVYRYTVDDQQLTAVGGSANFNQLINAEETVGQGAELDFEAYLTDSLLVTVGASYNDTEIRDAGLNIAPCGGGCTVTDPAAPVPGLVSIDGNPLPQAPRWVGNLTARWSLPVGADEFFVYTDWAYRSEVNFFLYDSVEFTGKPLLEGGLRLGYLWDNGRYEAAVYGRNITDREVVVGGIDFNNLTGFLNEPRTVGVEFTARY